MKVIRYAMKSWLSCKEKTDSKDDDLLAFDRHVRSIVRVKQIAYCQIMTRHQGNPLGIEFSNKAGDRWAFILENCDSAAPYRVQYFDERGFSGHSCYASIEDALEENIRDGYVIEDSGVLCRLFHTTKWQNGLAVSEIRQQHQLGLLSFVEMLNQLNRLQLVA
jgi:hypothetical protein